MNFLVVARGGFEPPTQGFSILCSTPELPRRYFVSYGSLRKKKRASKDLYWKN